MTDETANTDKKQSKPWQFKKGFDERRWLQGRPKVPKNVRALAENLLWEIASEEIENPKTGEKVDRLRALLRSLTTSKQSADKKEFLARLLGAVPQMVDVTSDGKAIGWKEFIESDSKPKPDSE